MMHDLNELRRRAGIQEEQLDELFFMGKAKDEAEKTQPAREHAMKLSALLTELGPHLSHEAQGPYHEAMRTFARMKRMFRIS